MDKMRCHLYSFWNTLNCIFIIIRSLSVSFNITINSIFTIRTSKFDTQINKQTHIDTLTVSSSILMYDILYSQLTSFTYKYKMVTNCSLLFVIGCLLERTQVSLYLSVHQQHYHLCFRWILRVVTTVCVERKMSRWSAFKQKSCCSAGYWSQQQRSFQGNVPSWNSM